MQPEFDKKAPPDPVGNSSINLQNEDFETARKASEDALRRSEEKFREMAEHIDDVFYTTELEPARFLYVSPAYKKIWGHDVEELYLRPERWTFAIVPEDRIMALAARELLARGEEYCIEYRIRRPDGELRWIEDRSFPIQEPGGKIHRAAGVAIDITRRRQLEAQLLQAQKMEAVGQLAGGVAHDFNNLLTVVIGYARLLLDRGNMPLDTTAPLTQIFNAGTRAATLTRQLLLFSSNHTVNRAAIDLNQVVREISVMLRRVIGEHITLNLALQPGTSAIEADVGMIEQVLMNLAVNARDAMESGGTLTITTAHLKLDETTSKAHAGGRPGEFVSVAVSDTGCGIAPEVLQRVFEPFFTTKREGHGTGLGLAMVFGIVKQHQGWIELESTVGVGTCFRVVLPAAAKMDVVEERRIHKKAPARGGTETMLLVEDDPAVREFAVAVLGGQGYRVLQACSGVDALEVWKWHSSKISLVFSDLVLPDGMGGVELAARLRQEKPALRVVLTSGYASETIGAEFRPPAATHFLHKPYKPQVLVQAVRDALDDKYNQ